MTNCLRFNNHHWYNWFDHYLNILQKPIHTTKLYKKSNRNPTRLIYHTHKISVPSIKKNSDVIFYAKIPSNPADVSVGGSANKRIILHGSIWQIVTPHPPRRGLFAWQIHGHWDPVASRYPGTIPIDVRQWTPSCVVIDRLIFGE